MYLYIYIYIYIFLYIYTYSIQGLTHYNNLGFKQTQRINDFSAVQLCISFVSSDTYYDM